MVAVFVLTLVLTLVPELAILPVVVVAKTTDVKALLVPNFSHWARNLFSPVHLLLKLWIHYQ